MNVVPSKEFPALTMNSLLDYGASAPKDAGNAILLPVPTMPKPRHDGKQSDPLTNPVRQPFSSCGSTAWIDMQSRPLATFEMLRVHGRFRDSTMRRPNHDARNADMTSSVMALISASRSPVGTAARLLGGWRYPG